MAERTASSTDASLVTSHSSVNMGKAIPFWQGEKIGGQFFGVLAWGSRIVAKTV